MLDVVYEFAKVYWSLGVPLVQVREQLAEECPTNSLYDLIQWYEKSCALLDASVEVAERVRLELLTIEQGLLFLEQSHPGFSMETYRDAYAQGLIKAGPI